MFALGSAFHLEFLDVYNEMFNEIKSKEQQYFLDINKVVVTSSFGNGGVSTREGIDIGIKDTSVLLNEDVYKKFSDVLNVPKENEKLTLQLGYGMRSLNIIGDRASVDITAGSHCAVTDIISFDAKVYNILGKDAMIHRFGHEMLHEFGFPEEIVTRMEDEFYHKIKNFSEGIISSVVEAIPSAEYSLKERMERLFAVDTRANGILMYLYNYVIGNMLVGYTGNEEITYPHPITREPVQIPIF